jgi:SAM-dependent methyltransferase
LHADDAMLHFAPETALRKRLRARVGNYATADLFAAGVDHVLDITAIAMPDETWDVVLASHVLEHVDDKKAFAELFRILRPGGRMLILVPVAEGWETTYENAAITDPRLKALHYGKDNHVRRYGRDIRDRIAAAGFEVEAFNCDGATSVRLGLLPGENLFIGRKPPRATNG